MSIKSRTVVVILGCLAFAGCAGTSQVNTGGIKPETGGQPSKQEYHSLFAPEHTQLVPADNQVLSWQRNCDDGRFADELQQPQYQIFLMGSSVFLLKRENKQFVATYEIPSVDGKSTTKGRIVVMRTLNIQGEQISFPALSGLVWTPRTESIGVLDLSLEGKITLNPQFDFEAFKSNASVIPFGNGYAVNLYGQKLGEKGYVKHNKRPIKTYLSTTGRSLPGRLIRKNRWRIQEFILSP